MDADEVREALDRWTMGGLPERSRGRRRPPIARAQGAVIHDVEGGRYLDFGAIPAGAVLGHNHPRYIEAIKRRLHAIGDDAFLDADALRLHCRLGEILTPPLQKSLFVPQGEAAIRIAAGMARAITGAADMVSVSVAHDGTLRFTHPALAASPQGASLAREDSAASGGRAGCPDPSQCSCGAQDVSRPCPWAAFDAALRACEQRPAALLMKPYAGAALDIGAARARMLRRLCHQNGMLLLIDETATGYGRTGRMWAHQHDDVVPDILIVSARFGAGLSVAAVCTTPDIAEQLRGHDCLAPGRAWHDPVACTAAATAIDIVQEEDLVARAAAIGGHLKVRLGAMAADKPLIKAIRGRGAMYAIELAATSTATTSAQVLTRAVVRSCRDKGLLLQDPACDESPPLVRVAPPMVSTETQIDEGLDILDCVLREMTGAFYARTASGKRSPEAGQHQLSQ